VVDATNAQAVARLRQRKRRPDKPLAVMLASLEEVKTRCEVSDEEARVLQSPQSPILLLRRRRDRQAQADIAEEVAPGNPYLGVMLPYTPLHHLLMERVGRPIVCTSGNLSEEPMAVTTEDALARLGPIADVFLVHDRPIVRPVDDSVARVTSDGLQLLRRARGYAPLPIELGHSGPTVLAVGGLLKNTVALALGSQVVVSQHVGDLDNVASADVHRQCIDDLLKFFRVTPEAVACDRHPDYTSTRYAEELASQWGVPLVRVQHHHAHVAACTAEHGLAGPVLGLSWDGTGYGTDGTVWGGEALECDSSVDFRRIAHLRTFALAGGDRAVREPRRSALGILFEVFGPEAAAHAAKWFSAEELRGLLHLLARPRLCPRTSSLGRLFDAVAALCGLPPVISFEGQAAMALEFAADEDCEEAYAFALSDGSPAIADWEPVLRAILADQAAGLPVARISSRFHNALADLAVAIARRWGGRDVVLSGGCFQNALLSRRVRERLLAAGFQVYTHRLVPPNDGGIALGQAAIAARSGLQELCEDSITGRQAK
jgi:hydrogenase maturation protein HypF